MLLDVIIYSVSSSDDFYYMHDETSDYEASTSVSVNATGKSHSINWPSNVEYSSVFIVLATSATMIFSAMGKTQLGNSP